MNNLLSDVEDLLGHLAGMKDPEIEKMRAKVGARIDSARETLSENAENLREKVRAVASGTNDYVRESPWQALGIAALVGAAVGYLLAARR
ncbi:MAG TPA: hypothetical protein VMI92_04450 [Steroidobacteraceae bacterium]|nr:hypothetical protein [Steroidobacteraceae bacterium]